MRRYIIAIMTLFTLTSCVLSDGTSPEKNSTGRLLYNEVKELLNLCTSYTRYVVLTDMILSTEDRDTEVVKDFCSKVEVVENQVIFTVKGDYISTQSYTVVTDGKPLSEGGVFEVSNSNRKVLVATGVKGVERSFSVGITEEYSVYANYCDHLCHYDIGGNYIDLSITGSGKIEEDKSYTIHYTINDSNPLVYRNFVSCTAGQIDIDYQDLVMGKSRSTTVTFDPEGEPQYRNNR